MSILIIEKNEGTIKNKQPRETGNILHEPDVSMVRNGMHHTIAANCFILYQSRKIEYVFGNILVQERITIDHVWRQDV